MTDYQETLRRHRRLAILRHLEASPEYTSNASILQDVLAAVGLRSTRDQVTTEIVWLQEQGFLLADGDGFLVVTATARGAEIARGVATHPDVQRPGPR
ncbi:VpaChn25_0724 family phage protein [Tabrizicola flagellatus]|uniref:VpaChn25_0724 family phage protein n=1 Tax=Tabrizicola flagellatus TaxID=2593021 RepID=UPI0011F27CA5|nr:hypothetical protein [Tabrizicola flagellatus]